MRLVLGRSGQPLPPPAREVRHEDVAPEVELRLACRRYAHAKELDQASRGRPLGEAGARQPAAPVDTAGPSSPSIRIFHRH
jgi:hypothetical protein